MINQLRDDVRIEPWRRQPVRYGNPSEIFVQCINNSLGTFYARLTHGPHFLALAFGRIEGTDFVVDSEAHVSVLFFGKNPELRALNDGHAWNWKELNAFLDGLEALDTVELV